MPDGSTPERSTAAPPLLEWTGTPDTGTPEGDPPGPPDRVAAGPRPVPAAWEELFTLRRGVLSGTLPSGAVHLSAWPNAEPLGRLTPGQRAVLRALAGRAHTGEELTALAAGHDGHASSGAVAHLLDQLRAGGWLKVTVSFQGRALYTLDPLRPPPAPPRDEEAESGLVLSRFTVLHRDGGDLVLESTRAWCEIRVHEPATVAGVLGRLAAPSAESPAESQAQWPPAADMIRRLAHDLYWAGMAVPASDGEDEDGEDEDGELRLRQWSSHDLWFHGRSRMGYRGFPGDGHAATYWARGRFESLPARPEAFGGPALDLYRPDLETLRRTDPALTAVLEERRSVREQDDIHPITGAQLGEFLYRCFRTRGTPVMAEGYEITSRPYPSAGGAYELEVYPVVRHAAGLAPGMYHYDSHAHQLRLVQPVSHPAVRRLLRASTAAGQGPSQVLLVVSARVGRLMWKYEAIGYALVLKHVGALYQTMYCVATAMGLAPCAIGTGDDVSFTQATGRDPLDECSVGEFVLGSAPESAPAGAAPRGGPGEAALPNGRGSRKDAR